MSSNIDLLREQDYIYHDDKHLFANQQSKSGGGVLYHFIKQLSPGLDLTRVTSPSFLLKPVSFLEMQANYSSPILDIVAPDINSVPSTVCMLRVLKWLTHSWSLTPIHNNPSSGLSAIKPYNPILGEQFHCYWMLKDNDGTDNITEFHAEQVSHHPPVCAVAMFNRRRKFIYTAHGELKSQFKGNSVDAFVANTNNVLRFVERGEHYKISLPGLTAHGLIFGHSRLEHSGSAVVDCYESGLRAIINFERNHRINGQVIHVPSNTILYTIQGDLTDVVSFRECSMASSSASQVYQMDQVLMNSKLERGQALPKIVRPLWEQSDNESRRVWHNVTYALMKGDANTATTYKSAIEEAQRQKDTSTFVSQLFQSDTANNCYRYYLSENQLFQN